MGVLAFSTPLHHYTKPFLLDTPLATPRCHAHSASSTHGPACSSLRTVKITFDGINEIELRMFAFSTLVELEVVPVESSQLTLGSLVVLASQCPRLQRLTRSLCGDDHPPSRDQACPTLAELIYLNVAYSTIGDPHEIALFLWDLCPQLTSVESCPTGIPEEAAK